MGAATEILHTQRRLGFFFPISVYLSQTEILSNWFGSTLSAPKKFNWIMMSSAFSSQLLHTLAQTGFPIVYGVLSSYTVSIHPSHWSLATAKPRLRIFAYWQCTNTPLSPTPFLPLSSFPSFLRHNLQNAHKKFLFKLDISSSALLSIFPSILLEKSKKTFLFHVLIQYLLHQKTEWQPALPEMFEFNHCKSPLTAVPGVKNTKWKCTHVKLFKIAGIFCTHYGLSTSR